MGRGPTSGSRRTALFRLRRSFAGSLAQAHRVRGVPHHIPVSSFRTSGPGVPRKASTPALYVLLNRSPPHCLPGKPDIGNAAILPPPVRVGENRTTISLPGHVTIRPTTLTVRECASATSPRSAGTPTRRSPVTASAPVHRPRICCAVADAGGRERHIDGAGAIPTTAPRWGADDGVRPTWIERPNDAEGHIHRDHALLHCHRLTGDVGRVGRPLRADQRVGAVDPGGCFDPQRGATAVRRSRAVRSPGW